MRILLVFGCIALSSAAVNSQVAGEYVANSVNQNGVKKAFILPYHPTTTLSPTPVPTTPTTTVAPTESTTTLVPSPPTTTILPIISIVTNATTTESPKLHDFANALEKYVREQRNALDKFESDVSKDNLGTWMRSLMMDFETTDHEFKTADGSMKAKYRVMLKSADSEYKRENLLILTHAEAVKYCTENFDNGTLLTIHSAGESAEMIDWLYQKMRLPTKIWLGATKVRRANTYSYSYNYNNPTPATTYPSQMFLWDDNFSKLTFTNWHSGKTIGSTYNFGSKCEPSDSGETENCLEMLPHYYYYPDRCDVKAVAGNWNDITCDQTTKNAVICKKMVT